MDKNLRKVYSETLYSCIIRCLLVKEESYSKLFAENNSGSENMIRYILPYVTDASIRAG